MTLPEPSLARVCPFLGIPDDPGSHYSFPEMVHRCHARRDVVPIELGYQATHCLGGDYPRCARFQTATTPIPAWHPAAGAPVSHQTTTVAHGGRLVETGRRTTILLAGIAVATFVAAGLLLAASVMSPGSRTEPTDAAAVVPGTPSEAPVQTEPPMPSPPASEPTPGETDPATEAPPTASPSPRGTSVIPTPIIHVVQEGEWLSSIAEQYGLDWTDIAAANELENPDVLYVGQRLVIPTAVGATPSP